MEVPDKCVWCGKKTKKEVKSEAPSQFKKFVCECGALTKYRSKSEAIQGS